MTETYDNGNVSTMQACVLTGHSLGNARDSYTDPKNLLNVSNLCTSDSSSTSVMTMESSTMCRSTPASTSTSATNNNIDNNNTSGCVIEV